MADVVATFKALVMEVEEARALLTKKKAVEREIADAEKRLVRLQKDVETVNQGLTDINQKIGAEQARYEHEKRRYALLLETQQKDIEQEGRRLQAQYAEEKAAAAAAHKKALAETELERNQLRAGLTDLRGEHERLKKHVDTFKQRLTSALPE